MDLDEEDFLFFGTPIEREEEISSRKKKAVAEASGLLRTLPAWKQEVRDEEGRRRFHGAFTGGFSAGYYNSVGSKEGWTPQSFTSSRKNRAEIKQQDILNFLDEDEKSEMEGRLLGTSSQFDTFGFTAAELARKQVDREQSHRPSAIPGPVPDELILPAAESIGVKLLQKMGWRHGRAIKDQSSNSLYDARREARKAFLAFSSDDATPRDGPVVVDAGLDVLTEKSMNDVAKSIECTQTYINNPKRDLHGLGYDPYKHAPEFREKKRSRLSGKEEVGKRRPFSTGDNLFSSKSGKFAPGFGIGALEELDIEDEDVYASGYDFEETYVQEDEEPLRLTLGNEQKVDSKKMITGKHHGTLPGFTVATASDYLLERFDPPAIPDDFVPCHKFAAPLSVDSQTADFAPPEVSPPLDNNLKVMIEGVAALVARSGKLLEDLFREKNQSNPLFSFLNGGDGHDYYARKLWEERLKRNDQGKPLSAGNLLSSAPKMTAEARGRILGEKPLERSSKDPSPSVASPDVHMQFALSDTFTKPESFGELLEAAMPFKDDPAKQERFKQFLKDKYQGGLRSTDSGGASHMSEAARAHERLDFEAAAETIEKAKLTKKSDVSAEQLMEFSTSAGLQFTSGAAEVKATQAEGSTSVKMYPKREVFEWRPATLLCKRFDIDDPFMGKPPPAPKRKSKMDSVLFGSDFVTGKKEEETGLQSDKQDIFTELPLGQNDSQAEVENVERPVDLYKAIFSDDSDDERGEDTSNNQVEDPQKKIEAANTTLSRLIAGDFLESLGKELGLEVPADAPITSNMARSSASQKDATANVGRNDVISTEDVDEPPSAAVAEVKETARLQGDTSKLILHKSAKREKDRSSSRRHDWQSGDFSSEDERRKKRSDSPGERRKKRSRHSHHGYGDTDSSDVSGGDRYHSRSTDRKKRSSREKSHSREHSKHKRIKGDSPVRSSRSRMERDDRESRNEKHRHRRRGSDA